MIKYMPGKDNKDQLENTANKIVSKSKNRSELNSTSSIK